MLRRPIGEPGSLPVTAEVSSRYERYDSEGGRPGYSTVDLNGGLSTPGGGSGNYSSSRTQPASFPVVGTLITVAVGFLLSLFTENLVYLVVILTICTCGGLFAKYLSRWVLSKDEGTPEMRNVSEPIREGAEGFLRVQYGVILKMAVLVTVAIFFSYRLRDFSNPSGIEVLGANVMGFVGSVSFVLGAACSAIAGYVSMWVSARSNIRVASAARRSYVEAMIICFRGGAFSAVLVLAMCVGGVSSLYGFLYFVLVPAGNTSSDRHSGVNAANIPLLMAGYGFGASFVALFMQLGGGIYTKAADVGADLVGKVEVGIPEDDPRNPAVIADLVGDMVGDCVGSSADIFESIAAEIIGAMILAGVLASEGGIPNVTSYIFFPVMVHAVDIIVSSIGIMYISQEQAAALAPMDLLKSGYNVAIVCAFFGFIVTTRTMLYVDAAPSAWLHFLGCGCMGMATSYVFITSTQYNTDYAYPPVRSIAAASTTGHGTNIIAGVAVGMKSTAVPVVMVSCAVLVSYWLGRTCGLVDVANAGSHNAGLFGTAVCTMGMLSSAGYVLAMNNYGPIADNAGGIAEMSQQPHEVRDITDRLDAAGNVTKAITKGYSIGSAALACFVLFGALLDEFSAFAGGVPFRTIDIAVPEVLIGGLLGTAMVFYFVGLAVAAVGTTAGEVVKEVRRQFDAFPGIMEFKCKPDYRSCVALVTAAGLREMRLPGILAVGAPVVVGLFFRLVGDATGRPMLGAEVLVSFIMFGTLTGILMALFLDNVGGAWDNAKKYIEMGNHGGKGSEAHKASVTGDTVGDPFKDTAGPALHVVIKLLSTTVLVLGPIFVSKHK